MSEVVFLGRSLFLDEMDIVNININYGKLAECFLLYDVVNFIGGETEYHDLINHIGEEKLITLIKIGRIKLYFLPELHGVFSPKGDLNKYIPMMLVNSMQELREQKITLFSALKESDPELKITNKIDEIIEILPRSFAESISKLTYIDLSDFKYRKFVSDGVKSYFRRNSLLTEDFFSVNDSDGIHPIIERFTTEDYFKYWKKGLNDDILLMLIVNEVVIFADLVQSKVIYTNEIVQKLANFKLTSSTQFAPNPVDIFDKTLEINDLPDLEFLINQDLIDIDSIVTVSNSTHGKTLRTWINSFLDGKEKTGLEDFYKYYIQTIEGIKGFDKLRGSGVFKFAKFAVISIAGFFLSPAAALALSGGDFALDNLPLREWKPNLFIKKRIASEVDSLDLKERKSNPKNYPDIFQLMKKGYNLLSIYPNSVDSGSIQIELERDEGRDKFEIDLPDKTPHDYVLCIVDFYNASFSESYKQLINLLYEGWDIINTNLSVSRGEDCKLNRSKYEVTLSKDGQSTTISSNEQDFTLFIMTRRWNLLKIKR